MLRTEQPPPRQQLSNQLDNKDTDSDPPGILRHRYVPENGKGGEVVLPHERVFPIQIGSELFRLSGASLSSDGKLSLFHSRSFLVWWIIFGQKDGWMPDISS